MTEVKKITVHRALAELKLLDSKIEKSIEQLTVTKAVKKSADALYGVGVEDYQKLMQATFDKARGLIKYRNELKSAIVLSNALTKVTIGTKEMTVAEAIERKTSISHDKDFIYKIQSQLKREEAVVNKENDSLSSRLETYLVNMFGNKDKMNETDLATHRESFMKLNEWGLLDPMKIREKLVSLEDEVSSFEVEVDAVLSESNAITFIEVALP